MELPKIRKSIESYVSNEDGKISKQAIIAMGAFLGASALSNEVVGHGNDHLNSISLSLNDNVAQGMHSHHASY